jgi:hypothetical protein
MSVNIYQTALCNTRIHPQFKFFPQRDHISHLHNKISKILILYSFNIWGVHITSK